jgi:periplasmic protein TonB
MRIRVLAGAVACGLFVASCGWWAPKPETPPSQPEVFPPGPVAKPTPAPSRPVTRATTLDGYKIEVAKRIASSSSDLFTDPLPEMLKSVVVLDISIGRDGTLQQVSLRRSNGIRQLEQRAEANVRKAAPFGAPHPEVLRGATSVRFLETFLFRDDGRFQIRSLVDAS